MGSALVSLYLCALVPSLGLAESFSGGPEERARLRQGSELRGDWTGTDLYDLERPVTLVVNIEGLLLPEEGNAELLFSPLGGGSEALVRMREPAEVYLATLQLASELRRLPIGGWRFDGGARARLSGWPATARNLGAAVLLVDEIELVRGGQRFSLHDYPRMRYHRASVAGAADTPDS